jgi:hypothetical protein
LEKNDRPRLKHRFRPCDNVRPERNSPAEGLAGLSQPSERGAKAYKGRRSGFFAWCRWDTSSPRFWIRRLSFDTSKIDAWDWKGVNFKKESQGPEKGPTSIQHRVIDRILSGAFGKHVSRSGHISCRPHHSVEDRTSLHFLTPQNGHFLGKRERLSAPKGNFGSNPGIPENERRAKSPVFAGILAHFPEIN